MALLHADPGTCLLPLLLTLPPGAVAGIPTGARSDRRCLDADLDAFGPRLRRDGELRHAVSRPPAQVVVEAGGVSAALLEAALPALRLAGTVAVIRSDDRGLLSRLGDLVLQEDGDGAAWLGSASYRAARCLEFLVDGLTPAGAAWMRVPLDRPGGAEALLSAARADGLRVRESRIAYGWPPAR